MEFVTKMNKATGDKDGKSIDIRKFITLPAYAKSIMDMYSS